MKFSSRRGTLGALLCLRLVAQALVSCDDDSLIAGRSRCLASEWCGLSDYWAQVIALIQPETFGISGVNYRYLLLGPRRSWKHAAVLLQHVQGLLIISLTTDDYCALIVCSIGACPQVARAVQDPAFPCRLGTNTTHAARGCTSTIDHTHPTGPNPRVQPSGHTSLINCELTQKP